MKSNIFQERALGSTVSSRHEDCLAVCWSQTNSTCVKRVHFQKWDKCHFFHENQQISNL